MSHILASFYNWYIHKPVPQKDAPILIMLPCFIHKYNIPVESLSMNWYYWNETYFYLTSPFNV